MIQAFLDRAISKSSLTILAPSPTYFCTSSEPITRIKQASVRFATALASRVLPVPGGPNNKTPFGGSIPSLTNRSGCKWEIKVKRLVQYLPILSIRSTVSIKNGTEIHATCHDTWCMHVHVVTVFQQLLSAFLFVPYSLLHHCKLHPAFPQPTTNNDKLANLNSNN